MMFRSSGLVCAFGDFGGRVLWPSGFCLAVKVREGIDRCPSTLNPKSLHPRIPKPFSCEAAVRAPTGLLEELRPFCFYERSGCLVDLDHTLSLLPCLSW